jgi:hypothetical protein
MPCPYEQLSLVAVAAAVREFDWLRAAGFLDLRFAGLHGADGGRSLRNFESGAVADIRLPGGGLRAQRN